jgi:hypothetical protein
VQQGDPLGSTLFALAIHPVLLEIGRAFPHVLITAYAENVVLSGSLSEAKKAHSMYHSNMSSIGLKINSHESELHIPQWRDLDTAALSAHDALQVFINDLPPKMCIPMLNDDYIPIAQSGLQIVGVPLGTHQFCQQQIQKTILSIKADLDLLKTFYSLHQLEFVKLALYCCNTRISYFLRLALLRTSSAWTVKYDEAFECVFRRVLHFPLDSQDPLVSPSYDNALEQLRLPITKGGFGLASAEATAPGGLYSAVVGFVRWHAKRNLVLVLLSAGTGGWWFSIRSGLH